MSASARPRQTSVRRVALRVAALPVLAVGLLLTAVGFVGTQRLERRYARSVFATAAARPATTMQRQIDLYQADLRSIRRLYLASQLVERDEFAGFVAPIVQQHHDLLALLWAPHVLRGERAALEASAAAEGLAGLRIRERDGRGRRVEALQRDEYLPVWFAEPRPTCEPLLGLDLELDRVAAGAVRNACGTGTPRAFIGTALLPSDARTILGVVVPVYGQNGTASGYRQVAGQPVLGCLVALIGLEGLLDDAAAEAPGLELELYDRPDPGNSYPLVTYTPPEPDHGTLRLALRDLRHASRLDVAGTHWSLICTPTAQYTGAAGAWRAWWLVALGICLSVLVAAYVSAVTGRVAWAERLVEERTADLSRANEALRESEERFRQLVERMREGLAVIDTEGRLTYANATMCQMLGYAESELLGHGPSDFMDEANGAILRRQAALRRHEEGEPYELAWRHRSGRTVHTIISPRARRDARGAFLGSFAVITDITRRKLAEERLERMSAELRRSNQELEQFAYVASHDLQEPLRKIAAFGDRLEARAQAGLDEQARDYLARMRSAARRMQRLIDDLLLYSRVTTKGEPFVTVDLGEVAQGVLSDLEVRIQETGARIEVGSLPSIEADPSQMRQLIQNLLSNALKFRRPDAQPAIEVTGQIVAGGAGDGAPAGRELCELSVRDNGIGFDSKYAERIFGVFQRLHTREEYAGTGIGLAICRRVVERHGGRIWAKSTPQEGSTFTVRLPVTQPREEPSHGQADEADRDSGGR